MKITIEIEGPILPGSVSTARSQCGKQRCACKEEKPRLHGPYYRWTGVVNGKRTTKTISKEEAQECRERIARYKNFKRQVDNVIRKNLMDAPWLLNEDE